MTCPYCGSQDVDRDAHGEWDCLNCLGHFAANTPEEDAEDRIVRRYLDDLGDGVIR